jgi:raffinose/stachyose/melibiose transport system substrate-binding protein
MKKSNISNIPNPLSRREFLKQAAWGAGAIAAPGFLSACGSSPASPPSAAPTAVEATTAATSAPVSQAGGNLKMWWWGEQEAVGIQKWIEDTLVKFKAETGIDIESTLLDTDAVVPQFTTAAASGEVPDVQFFWNGTYFMDSVWLGYVQALNGLVADDVLKKAGATKFSHYEGKQYRVGFYSIGLGVQYNKEMFDKAGLNPDAPPEKWDDFMTACEKFKGMNLTPVAGGVKDGYFGDWFIVHTLTQNLDTPAEGLELFIGNADWREPKYRECWDKFAEMYQAGYFNNDVNSLDLYQGIQIFDTGKAAMCLNTTPAMPNSMQQLGADNVGLMVMPVFGTGKMAGLPVLDTQGFGIPSKAADQKNAARLLEFMHSPERVQAMWTLSRQIPANTSFDSRVIEDPVIKGIVDKWVLANNNANYITVLMPFQAWNEGLLVACQKILAGEINGEQAAEICHEATQKWKSQNPDMYENFARWRGDLGV